MKKIVVVLLVLFLLGLSGIEGCPETDGFGPPEGREDFRPGRIPGEETVRIRGLTVEFEKGKPLLTSIPGESLPVIWAEDKIEIGLKIDNYAPKKIRADVKIFSLATGIYGGKIIHGEDSLILESADIQDSRVYPGTNIVEFGPFYYSRERVGEYLEDSLITEIDLDYNGLVTADICFSREDSRECSNYATLTENFLKGDAGFLPVSINEIVKQATIKDNIAKIRLFIKFRNFGNGYIQGNRLTRFSAEIGGVGLVCDDVIFNGGEAGVVCKGSISFSGEQAFMTLPAKFEFDYLYEVKKSMRYKVVSE